MADVFHPSASACPSSHFFLAVREIWQTAAQWMQLLSTVTHFSFGSGRCSAPESGSVRGFIRLKERSCMHAEDSGLYQKKIWCNLFGSLNKQKNAYKLDCIQLDCMELYFLYKMPLLLWIGSIKINSNEKFETFLIKMSNCLPWYGVSCTIPCFFGHSSTGWPSVLSRLVCAAFSSLSSLRAITVNSIWPAMLLLARSQWLLGYSFGGKIHKHQTQCLLSLWFVTGETKNTI